MTGLAIGCGAWLINQIKINGVDISASGHSLETLAASVELLRIFYRTRHPELPPGEVEVARQRIFDAAA